MTISHGSFRSAFTSFSFVQTCEVRADGRYSCLGGETEIQSSLRQFGFRAENQILLGLITMIFLCHTAFQIIFSGILIMKFEHYCLDVYKLMSLDFFLF